MRVKAMSTTSHARSMTPQSSASNTPSAHTFRQRPLMTFACAIRLLSAPCGPICAAALASACARRERLSLVNCDTYTDRPADEDVPPLGACGSDAARLGRSAASKVSGRFVWR